MIQLAASPGVNTPAARKVADRVIPSWEYKRPITRHESKLDYRKLEIEHGLSMQGASLRLGLILSSQMESLIDWIRSPQFSEGRLSNIPERVLLAQEIRREFLRFYLRAYFDGAEAYTTWKGNYLRERGEMVRDGEAVVTFSDPLVGRLARFAARLGTAAIHAIETRIMPALESTWSPNGTRMKSADDLERELRTIYVNAFFERADLPRGAGILELARRMKIRNREQYARWQKGRLPYSKWIRQTAEQINAGSRAPVQLKRGLHSRWLGTERCRFFSHGVVDQARADVEVTHYQYSARGEKPCDICDARDGVIRRKDDDYWATNTPPMHHGCEHCTLIPIYSTERMKVTPKRELPSGDDVPDGYGTYNPALVRSARTLGVKRS